MDNPVRALDPNLRERWKSQAYEQRIDRNFEGWNQ